MRRVSLRPALAVGLVVTIAAAGCGGSGDPEWCEPAARGFVDLTEVLETFAAIADDAAGGGLQSAEEFEELMSQRVPEAVELIESAESEMAAAARSADGEAVAADLDALADALGGVAASLTSDPAALLGSAELDDVLAPTANQIQESCGETLADLAAA